MAYDAAAGYAETFARAAMILSDQMTGLRKCNRPQGNPLPLYPVVVGGVDEVFCFGEGSSAWDTSLIAPYVMNAAFALELYLKALVHAQSGTWPKKIHNLHELFCKLSSESRERIRCSFQDRIAASRDYERIRQHIRTKPGLQDFDWDLDVLLANSGSAFIDWRYVFEGRISWFGGFGELRLALISELHEALPTVRGSAQVRKLERLPQLDDSPEEADSSALTD